MQVTSHIPLKNKERMFRLRGFNLEYYSTKTDRRAGTINLMECSVKYNKETLVFETPFAKPMVVKPPTSEYDKWRYHIGRVRTWMCCDHSLH